MKYFLRFYYLIRSAAFWTQKDISVVDAVNDLETNAWNFADFIQYFISILQLFGN